MLLTPAAVLQNLLSEINCTSAGNGFLTSCPIDFASIYPEPSEPVFEAAFEPAEIITLEDMYLLLTTNKLSFFSIFSTFVSKTISTPRKHSSEIIASCTDAAVSECGYTYPFLSFGKIPIDSKKQTASFWSK